MIPPSRAKPAPSRSSNSSAGLSGHAVSAAGTGSGAEVTEAARQPALIPRAKTSPLAVCLKQLKMIDELTSDESREMNVLMVLN